MTNWSKITTCSPVRFNYYLTSVSLTVDPVSVQEEFFVRSGQSGTFSVTAKSTPPLKPIVTWSEDGSALPSGTGYKFSLYYSEVFEVQASTPVPLILIPFIPLFN